jgi:tetratricopeptide (TPR) repeat protein
MKGMVVRALLALVAGSVFGCGPSQDARFAAAGERANAMARDGRHAEAAELWLEAARVADSAVDREEAEYRAASSYERGEKVGRALALYQRLERGNGTRAARASFDRARIVREQDPAQGDALLVAAIRRYPDSGLAPRALREHLARREAEDGIRAAILACTELLAELEKSELDEALRYERARLWEREGSLEKARDGYLDGATRHPYPKGALWDDALARAAELEERLGQPLAAIRILERMLAEREPSTGVGSYERARYAAARFRIAELHRDRLADPGGARREFRRVYEEHPTSLLRDDALWQEALVSVRSGDLEAACEPLLLLVKDFSDSRYAPCAPRLCQTVRPPMKARSCHVEIPEGLVARGSPPDAPHSSSSSSSSSSSP